MAVIDQFFAFQFALFNLHFFLPALCSLPF
jgi:hypothetical protein